MNRPGVMNPSVCSGERQSAAGVQSVAAGGAAAAPTNHQQSETQDESEGEGHGSAHSGR